jgi:hypothetical protein
MNPESTVIVEGMDDFEDDPSFIEAAASLEKSVIKTPQPLPQKSTKRKLQTDQSADPQSKRTRDDISSALTLKLKTIDPTQRWSIHKYYKNINSDKIVKEYVDLLLKIDFIPASPTESDISYFGLRKNLQTLSTGCVIKSMHLLMTYFQTRYFQTNLNGAATHNKAVINVQAKMSIPNFKDLPFQILQEMTEERKKCAINLQNSAEQGSTFMCELIKLRTAALIHDEIKANHQNCKISLCSELQIHFNVLFVKAKLEFFKQYPAKNISWNEYEDKVKIIQPNWRSNNLEVPETKNHYASNLEEKLSKSDSSLSAVSVQKEYEEFDQNGPLLQEKAKRSFQRTSQARKRYSAPQQTWRTQKQINGPPPHWKPQPAHHLPQDQYSFIKNQRSLWNTPRQGAQNFNNFNQQNSGKTPPLPPLFTGRPNFHPRHNKNQQRPQRNNRNISQQNMLVQKESSSSSSNPTPQVPHSSTRPPQNETGVSTLTNIFSNIFSKIDKENLTKQKRQRRFFNEYKIFNNKGNFRRL